MKVDAVILSYGAEMNSIAIYEELCQKSMTTAVVALRDKSLFADLCPRNLFIEMEWPPVSNDDAAKELARNLYAWGASTDNKIIIFAVEDGGLRLLQEYRHLFSEIALFSASNKLSLSGLDKAEFFNYLNKQGLTESLPKTIVISNTNELEYALGKIHKAIIKPALKPLSMILEGMDSKALLSTDFNSIQALKSYLEGCWNLSDDWLVQELIESRQQTDIAVYAVRNSHFFHAVVAKVRLRYPESTGTGCWVEMLTEMNHPAIEVSRKILETIDYNGICELEFLQAEDGSFKLIELNPRPWLQVGLTSASGVNLLSATVQLLRKENQVTLERPRNVHWICLERCVQSFLASKNKRAFLSMLYGFLKLNKTYAIYSTNLKGIRARWACRLLSELLKNKKNTS